MVAMTGAEKQAIHRDKVRARILSLELTNRALVNENRMLTAEVRRLNGYIEYVRDFVRRNFPDAIENTDDSGSLEGT
jgi:hypothetical protein